MLPPPSAGHPRVLADGVQERGPAGRDDSGARRADPEAPYRHPGQLPGDGPRGERRGEALDVGPEPGRARVGRRWNARIGIDGRAGMCKCHMSEATWFPRFGPDLGSRVIL